MHSLDSKGFAHTAQLDQKGLGGLANLRIRTILVAGFTGIIAMLLAVGAINWQRPERTPESAAVAEPVAVATESTPDLYFEMNEPMASFRGGSAALDYVLAHADTMNAANLLAGAATAYHLNRLQDAAFLFYAGRIRARYDLQKYVPTATGGDSPAVAIDFLVSNASGPIVRDIFFHARDYSAMVRRLEAWKIEEPTGYEPGWAYTLHEVPLGLAAKLKAETLNDARPMATLLSIPQYMDALRAMRAYNELPQEQQSENAAIAQYNKAERTMERIERARNLRGIYCQIHQKGE